MTALSSFILAVATVVNVAASVEKTKTVEMPAGDERAYVVGRSLVSEDGSVSFDWSGTELHVAFTGTTLKMLCSDSKADWYNVWIDKAPGAREDHKICVSGRDSLYVLAQGLDAGNHVVHIQKRTEGEQGRTTVKKFICDGQFIRATNPHKRLIEIIGDSYTCGYGSENSSRNDPFKAETENCNLSYSGILGRYFDADVVRIAHSGRGLVRNYNDGKGRTMVERYEGIFDMADEPRWSFESQKPDIVLIYLGTNDFSCGKRPSQDEWEKGTVQLVDMIRAHYGDDVPILMVASRASYKLSEYVKDAKTKLEGRNVHWTALFNDVHNNDADLGASWHPNYSGHRKVSCGMIPYISTITGWEMPFKAIE